MFESDERSSVCGDFPAVRNGMKMTVPRMTMSPSAMMISGLPISHPGIPRRIGLSLANLHSRYVNMSPRMMSHLRRRFWRVRSRLALASMSLPLNISPVLRRAISMRFPCRVVVSPKR